MMTFVFVSDSNRLVKKAVILMMTLLFTTMTHGEMLCDKGWQRGGEKCLK